MLTITLLIGAFSTITLAKAGLSYVFGYEYSYYGSSIYDPMPLNTEPTSTDYEGSVYDSNSNLISPPTPRPTENTEQRTNDLIYSSVALVVSGLIFVTHVLILKSFNDQNDVTNRMALKKLFVILHLIIFGVIGLVAIPTAINENINYLRNTSTTYYSKPTPGNSVATVLVTLPLWAFFLIKSLHLSKKEVAK